jgi:hypothetical protein
MNASASLSRAIGSIDHVVIAVPELAAAAAIYRRLGFTLSPRGVHSDVMGTENHTLMLRDDYFELLAVRLPTERNGYWRRVLDAGGGVGGMAMATQDPQAARAHWIGAGLSPTEAQKFSREVPRPDGSTLQARFEIVSLDEIADAGLRLFVCSQPTREAVWLPELLEHPNTATAVRRVSVACPDPELSARAWQRILPAAQARSTPEGVTLDTGRHELALLRRAVPQARGLGIDWLVADLERCRAALRAGAIPFEDDGQSLRVAASQACNVAAGFVAAT